MKKTLKRILSVVLTYVLVLAMGTSVFAGNEGQHQQQPKLPSITKADGTATGSNSGVFKWDFKAEGYQVSSVTGDINGTSYTVTSEQLINNELTVESGLLPNTLQVLNLVVELNKFDKERTFTIKEHDHKWRLDNNGNNTTKYNSYEEALIQILIDIKADRDYKSIEIISENQNNSGNKTIVTYKGLENETFTINKSDASSFTTDETTYKVTFDSVGGQVVDAIKVVEGGTITLPAIPNMSGGVFNGWYLNAELFDDSTQITQDITLVANWLPVNIYITADNILVNVYHNGVLLSPVYSPIGGSYEWQRIKQYYAPNLAEGDVIAVKAEDQGVVAGLLGQISFNNSSFPTASESNWRQSTVLEDGWYNKDFTPTQAWEKTTEHTYSSWNNLVGLPSGSNAQWIWTANNNYNANGDKVVYFRYYVGTMPIGDDTTGDDTTGDDTTGDDTTGDDTTGDDTTGDDTTGDDTTGDDTTGDNTTGDDTTGDNLAGDTAPENPILISREAAPVINYTLTVNTTEGGKVPGFLGTNTFSSGTNVNLSAIAESDLYEFVGWSGDLVSSDLNAVVVMTGNKTVTATFKLIEEVIPEAAVVEVKDEVVAQEAVTSGDTEILDQEVIAKEAPVALPQTSGIPMESFAFIGSAIMGLGVVVNKKRK